MIALLALACGAVAALPFVQLARHELVVLRARHISVPRAPRHLFAGGFRRDLRSNSVIATIVRVAGVPRMRRVERHRDARLRNELPVLVDLVGVAVAAGCTPFHAVEHAWHFGPIHTGHALQGVTQACARGRSFDEALRDLGASSAALRPLAEALRTSTRLGTPAAPALQRLAMEVRADVRRRAEARARTVPVRLCFPLVVCVLPAFALLTVVPAVFSGFHP